MKRKANKVVGIKAVGTQVLVEMLTDEESIGTRLTVNKASGVPPQAFVVDIGPALLSNDVDWGFKVGDRVLLQGNYVPVPRIDGFDRDLGMVEPHAIKCVLQEDSGIVRA